MNKCVADSKRSNIIERYYSEEAKKLDEKLNVTVTKIVKILMKLRLVKQC